MNKKVKKQKHPVIKQNKIMLELREFIKRELLPNPSISRIVAYGSIVKEIGKYKKSSRKGMSSSIDLLIVVDDEFINKSLIHKDSIPSCEVYKSRRLINKIHPIMMMVYNPKIHNIKSAIQHGMPINFPISRDEGILLYQRHKKI